MCMCAQDYEGVICEIYTGPTSTLATVTSETSTVDPVSSGNSTEVMLNLTTQETSTSKTFVNETVTPVTCTSIPVYVMTSSICQFSTRPPTMGNLLLDNGTSLPRSTAPPSIMEPPPITRIEDYISTQDPTMTTITTYTQLPALIELILETTTPATTSNIEITTVPDNVFEVVNKTDIGVTVLEITLSEGAYTTILVTTRQPSDIVLSVVTVDAENTAMLLFGTLNITLPTTLPMTEIPAVEKKTFIRYLSTEENARVVAFAATGSAADYQLLVYTENPMDTTSVQLETTPVCRSTNLTSLITNCPEGLLVSFQTLEAVNTTLLITLKEAANMSFQVTTADPLSIVELSEDTSYVKTQNYVKMLSTQGSSTLRAFASSEHPTNYTLTVYTRNPSGSVDVNVETIPSNRAQNLRFFTSGDSEAYYVTFDTFEAGNTTMIITLMESGNATFQFTTKDKSSIIKLEEYSPEPLVRTLSTQGRSTVTAYASTRSPADYMLVIYTKNSNDTATVGLETSPPNATYDLRYFRSDNPKALMVTFKTFDEVNATVLIRLMEAANISFQVTTADRSSYIELAEYNKEPDTVEPFLRTLSTQGSKVVRAFTSTSSPANYTLVIYTQNPEKTANFSLETSPANLAFDLKYFRGDLRDVFVVTFKTLEAVNATVILKLQESANISLQVNTGDKYSVVELGEFVSEPDIVQPILKTLSTQGRRVVRAVTSTKSPANYTLAIYIRNPNETIEVVLETSPGNASYDVRYTITDDMKALIVTYRTSGRVNSTLLITLQESANISFEIETADQSSKVELEEDDGMMSTVSPTVPPQMYRSLRTEGRSIVKAFATARSPANYTLIIYTENPNETVEVVLETSPGNASYDVRYMVTNDMKALIVTYRTAGRANSTLLITLQESANISFEIQTADDQSSKVKLEEDDDGMMSTVSPTVPPQMYRSLRTEGKSIVKAFATARSPANYTLIIYTKSPNETVEVVLETSPGNASYDVRYMVTDDMKALIVTYRTSGRANSTLLITLQKSANISFEIETADDQSSKVELEEEDDGMMSTVSPTVPPQMYRSLRTEGRSIVRAFATARSPANYTLIIYTRNPNETVEVVLETSPGNASYDVRYMVTDESNALVVTYRTSGEVNSTLLLTLQESANISFEIATADQLNAVELAEYSVFTRTLSTNGNSALRAFVSSRSPANYVLVIYTSDPDETANVSIGTVPANAAFDVTPVISVEPEALTVSFRTAREVNTTLFITLQAPANISFKVETLDPDSSVDLFDVFVDSTTRPPLPTTSGPPLTTTMMTTTRPAEVFTFRKALFALGDKTVLASVDTDGLTMYTLLVYALDAVVDVQTLPEGLALDVASEKSSEALVTTFSTVEPTNSKMFVNLNGPAIVTLKVDSTDASTAVTLAEVTEVVTERPDTTFSPAVVQSFMRELMTAEGTTVKGLVATSGPANYTVVVHSKNPRETVSLRVETDPADIAIGTTVFIEEDEEAVAMVFKTFEAVNTTIFISLEEPANITIQVDTFDRYSTVSLLEVGTTMQLPTMTSPTAGVYDSRTSLNTSDSALIEAFASTSGPANFTLFVYTMNPSENIVVAIETQPANLTSDVKYLFKDDEQALAVLFKVVEPANTTLRITVMEASRIILLVESDSELGISLEEIESTTAAISTTTTGDGFTSTPDLPSTTESAVVQMVSSNFTISGPANISFMFDLVKPATIYIMLNASSEGRLSSVPESAVQLESIFEDGNSRYTLMSMTPSNVTFVLSVYDAAVIVTTVEAVNANDVDVVIETILKPTDEPDVVTTPHIFGDTTIVEVTGVFSDEVTVFWSFNPEDEPFIQGFILQYREVSVANWTNSSLIQPSSRLFKLTGLKENTLYFLRLIAVDRSTNPAALSFQKPVKTLSRNIMDPVPDRGQVYSVDSFYWILIASIVLIVVLLVSVIASLILYTRRKRADKNSIGSGGSPTIQDDQV